MRRKLVTIREHQSAMDGQGLNGEKLDAEELSELAKFVPDVFKYQSKGALAARKFVGVVTIRKGTVVEILPKIDLDQRADDLNERTRREFLKMLRDWRDLRKQRVKQLPYSDIRSLSHFPMLEVFVRQFLKLLAALARGGLARSYIDFEENLPYLRGRLIFNDHLRENMSDRSRFYTSHDELSVDRPANRLIHTALQTLAPQVHEKTNRQLLRQSLIMLADVPRSQNPLADWRRHHIDRSIGHYQAVMQWVYLLLFQRGLTTFSGNNTNQSLLFPMEQVFEDFVLASFRRHQSDYEVISQGPRKHMATLIPSGEEEKEKPVFVTKPDMALRSTEGRFQFILDAKWKKVDANSENPKHEIVESDLYQLYAHAALNDCNAMALIYPRNARFESTLRYRFFDGSALLAVPFDVTQPQESVSQIIEALQASLPSSASTATAA